MHFRLRFLPSALALGLLALGGCAHHSQDASSANTLRVAMLAAPTTFDPATVEDGTTIDMLQQVFEGLVQWTPDNKVRPGTGRQMDHQPRRAHLHVPSAPRCQVPGWPPRHRPGRVFFPAPRPRPRLELIVTNYLEDIVGAKEVEKGDAALIRRQSD